MSLTTEIVFSVRLASGADINVSSKVAADLIANQLRTLGFDPVVSSRYVRPEYARFIDQRILDLVTESVIRQPAVPLPMQACEPTEPPQTVDDVPTIPMKPFETKRRRKD